jgi:hypothetical protein
VVIVRAPNSRRSGGGVGDFRYRQHGAYRQFYRVSPPWEFVASVADDSRNQRQARLTLHVYTGSSGEACQCWVVVGVVNSTMPPELLECYRLVGWGVTVERVQFIPP